MAERKLAVRFSAEGTEQVKAALQSMGDAGKKALQDIERASNPSEKALERLRVRFKEGYAEAQRFADATGQINAQLKSGRIDAAEHAELMKGVNARYGEGAKAVGGFAAAFRMGATEQQIFRSGLINTAQSMAAGMDPIRTLQTQIFQTAPAFANASRAALAFIAPIAAVTVALGLAGTAFAAGVAETKAFEQAVRMGGQNVGVTTDRLAALAAEAQNVSRVGPASARELVNAFASTGKIGEQAIGKLASITRDYASATKQDVSDAGQALAQMFADPLRGAQQLDQQYGLLSASEKRAIEDAVAQGRAYDAQTLLADKLGKRLKGMADDELSWLGRRWKDISDAASAAWDAMKGLGRADTLDQQLANAQARLSRVQNNTGARVLSGADGYVPEDEVGALAEVERLKGLINDRDEKARQIANEARLQREAKEADELWQSLNPVEKAKRDLENQTVKLQAAMALELTQNGMATESYVTMLGALNRLRQAKADIRSDVEKSDDQVVIARQVAAMAPRDQAAERARLTTLDSLRDNKTMSQADKDRIGDNAKTQAIIAETAAIATQNQQLALNAKLSTETAQAFLKGAADGERAAAIQAARVEAVTSRLSAQQRAQLNLNLAAAQAVVDTGKQIEANDRALAAGTRLNDAISRGAAAAHEAALQNEIEATTHDLVTKAKNSNDEATRKLAEAYARKIEVQKRAIDLQKQEESAERTLAQGRQQIELLQREGQLVGERTEVRAREIAMLQMAQRIENEMPAIDERRKKALIEQAGAIAEQSSRLQEFEQAAQHATDQIVDAFSEMFDGSKKPFEALRDFALKMFKEIAANAIIRPLISPIVSSITGSLMGVGGDGASGGGGGISGLLGTAANGASLYNSLGGGGFSLAGSLASGAQWLGLGTAPIAGISGISGVSSVAGVSTSFGTFDGLVGLEGAAGSSGIAGEGLAGIIGDALPWVGAGLMAVSLLSGLFGKKPSVGPGGQLTGTFGPNGYNLIGAGQDNGYQASVNQPAADAIGQQIADIVKQYGGTLVSSNQFTIGYDAGAKKYMGGGAYSAGMHGTFDNQNDAIAAAVLAGLKGSTVEGGAGLQAAFAKSSATTMDQFAADAAFGKWYDGLGKAEEKTSAAAQQLQVLNDNFDKAKAKAEEFGLSLEPITQDLARSKQKLADDFIGGLDKSLNDLLGKGYLNEAKDLAAQYADLTKNAHDLGVATDKVDQVFALSAQRLVDSAQLTGSAFDELIQKFPQLAGVVHAFTGSGAFRIGGIAANDNGPGFENSPYARAPQAEAEARAAIVQALSQMTQQLEAAAQDLEKFNKSLDTNDLGSGSLESKYLAAKKAYEDNPTAEAEQLFLSLSKRYQVQGSEDYAKDVDWAKQVASDKVTSLRASAAAAAAQMAFSSFGGADGVFQPDSLSSRRGYVQNADNEIRRQYWESLGRMPEEWELQFWKDQNRQHGFEWAYSADKIANSAEAQSRRAGIQHFAAGGLVRGAYSGVDNVPAMIMSGEEVVSRPVVDFVRRASTNDNSATAEIRALRGIAERQQRLLEDILDALGYSADQIARVADTGYRTAKNTGLLVAKLDVEAA